MSTKLTKNQLIRLQNAKNDKYCYLLNGSKETPLANAFWNYCKSIDFPYIMISREKNGLNRDCRKVHKLFYVQIDFYSCGWDLSLDDFELVFKECEYREISEIARAIKLNIQEWYSTFAKPTASSIHLLDEYEAIRTAENFVKFFTAFSNHKKQLNCLNKEKPNLFAQILNTI